MKFIHLTDPHLTSSGDLFEIDVDARLRAAVTSINNRYGDAELAMVTGDIAHWGEPGAYDRARDILGELSMPWYPLMGNHDVRDAFLAGLPNAVADMNGRACFRVNTSVGPFLALDTHTEGTHAGSLDEAQLDWLAGELDGTSSHVYLFLHHPPTRTGINGLDKIPLLNAGDIASLLDRNPGRVRHIFFGHMHRAFHGSWRGIPFSTVKSTAHQVAAIIDTDVPLTSSREFPAYAVVIIDDERVVVHDISYLEEETEFKYDRNRGKK